MRPWTLLVLLALTMPSQAAEPPWPADVPVDAEGIPTRLLSDDELHRLLLAHSARSDAVTLLLASCHSAGTPYGHPGWRACVDRAGRRPVGASGTP